MSNDQLDDDELLVVHTYTRAEAIADGVLVDVTVWAGSDAIVGGGFKIPVAFTRAVWNLVEAPKRSNQDTRGRAHDVIFLACCAAARTPNADRCAFTVRLGRRNVRLKLQVGPGDQGEPVATVMLPDED